MAVIVPALKELLNSKSLGGNTAAAATVPAAKLAKVYPVALTKFPLAGVPSAGVTNVGLVAKTKFPVPVAPALVTPSIVWCPVNVFAASVLAIVAEVDGNVIVVKSVPASVKILFTVKVTPFGTFNVPVLAVIAAWPRKNPHISMAKIKSLSILYP